MKEKILVAMSGGVDSSVAALLLKKADFDCYGATMRLFSADSRLFCSERSCCNPEEINDARRVADQLGIPYSVLEFSADFEQNVIDYFVDTYLKGGTPNPCVACNRTMKFGRLFEKGRELGYDGIATGHYARIQRAADRYLLTTAVDPGKDQSYVLWGLTQEMLARTHFPLGNLTKKEVRLIAEENGFCNAARKESQDICFIPDGDYVSFIERYTGKTFPCGQFLDRSGKAIGTHKGSIRYTIGQRKGLGIAFGEPTYVIAKDTDRNTVTLGRNEDLFTRNLTAHSVNLIALPTINTPLRVQAKIRYQATPAPAEVEQTDSGTIRLRFDQPQRAISPGQSVVLYDGDVVIGGGIID